MPHASADRRADEVHRARDAVPWCPMSRRQDDIDAALRPRSPRRGRVSTPNDASRPRDSGRGPVDARCRPARRDRSGRRQTLPVPLRRMSPTAASPPSGWCPRMGSRRTQSRTSRSDRSVTTCRGATDAGPRFASSRCPVANTSELIGTGHPPTTSHRCPTAEVTSLANRCCHRTSRPVAVRSTFSRVPHTRHGGCQRLRDPPPPQRSSAYLPIGVRYLAAQTASVAT